MIHELKLKNSLYSPLFDATLESGMDNNKSHKN